MTLLALLLDVMSMVPLQALNYHHSFAAAAAAKEKLAGSFGRNVRFKEDQFWVSLCPYFFASKFRIVLVNAKEFLWK